MIKRKYTKLILKCKSKTVNKINSFKTIKRLTKMKRSDSQTQLNSVQVQQRRLANTVVLSRGEARQYAVLKIIWTGEKLFLVYFSVKNSPAAALEWNSAHFFYIFAFFRLLGSAGWCIAFENRSNGYKVFVGYCTCHENSPGCSHIVKFGAYWCSYILLFVELNRSECC
jgi:hypothetical protein